MKGMLKVVVVLLALILLAVTNPSEEQHRSAIGERFSREHGVVGRLGGGLLYAQLPVYRDYVLCSLTRHEGEVKSVGLLGVVHAF